MQVKTFLKVLFPVCSLVVLFSGCNVSDSTQGEPPGPLQFPINTSSLPILQMNNWWKYVDGGGHHLSMSVVDTITDNKVKYYEVVFAQQGVDTVDDWFIQSSTGTEYGSSLRGSYNLFLPAQLNSTTGSFLSDSSHVTYAYSDSTTFGSAPFRFVIQLSYSRPFYHGFNEVDLADSIGIIRLVDSVGQVFPVIYELDSSSIRGQLKVY